MAAAKQSDKGENGVRVDAAQVRELADLLTENNLTEIEVTDGARKIRVRRDAAPVAPPAWLAAT